MHSRQTEPSPSTIPESSTPKSSDRASAAVSAKLFAVAVAPKHISTTPAIIIALGRMLDLPLGSRRE